MVRGQTYALELEQRLDEGRGLADAIGLNVIETQSVSVRDVRPNTLFGSGQVENIATACEQGAIELVVVDGALSAIQQRNLEDRLSRKVIDRTGLILEIFGERAATAEGRLQVELAHLDYQQSRLVRSWTHLERQRGGFGFLGGPGETQIEADRRMIRQRIARLRKELEQVRKTRALHRERRNRAPWPVISLVGYTNAGKSTLFNHLTKADVLAEDMLFATLDPTMRAISLPGIEKAIVSDTVGFISDLPTQLVAAFRATLEEVVNADVICHVRDISSASAIAQKEQVLEVMRELRAEGEGDDETVPVVEVWNKIDLLEGEEREDVLAAAAKDDLVVALSAHDGTGLQQLFETLRRVLSTSSELHRFTIPTEDGHRVAWLHAHGEVQREKIITTNDGRSQTIISVRLNPKEFGRFESLS